MKLKIYGAQTRGHTTVLVSPGQVRTARDSADRTGDVGAVGMFIGGEPCLIVRQDDLARLLPPDALEKVPYRVSPTVARAV